MCCKMTNNIAQVVQCIDVSVLLCGARAAEAGTATALVEGLQQSSAEHTVME